MSKASNVAAAKPQGRRRSASNILIVANSPGSRRYTYEQRRAYVLKTGHNAVGSEPQKNTETLKSRSNILLRGRFTAEEIVRAIEKAKQ
jgi:hypothetical protein